MKNLTRKQRLLVASALSMFALAALAATFGSSSIGFNANTRTNIQTDLKIQFQRMGLGTPAGSSGTPFSVLDGGAGSFGQGGTDIPIIYRTLALSGFPPSRYAIQLKLTSRDEFGSDEYGFVRYYNGFTTNREELAGKLVLGSDGENFDGDSATGVAVDLSSDAVSGQTFDVRTGSDLRFQVATNSAYAKAMTSETGTHTGITTRNDQSDFKITSAASAASISLSWTNSGYSIGLAHNATVTFTDPPTSTSKERELRIWVTNTASYTFTLGTVNGQSIIWDAEGSTTQPAIPANDLTQILLIWNGTNTVGVMSTEPVIADGANGPDPGSFVFKDSDTELLRSGTKADVVALGIIKDSAYDADDDDGITDTAPSLDTFRDAIEELRELIGAGPGISAETSTTDNTATPIWTNTISTGYSVQLGARVLGAGPTNVYAFDIRALAKNPAGTASLVGTNDLSIIPSGGTNMSSYWGVSGANAILYVRGFSGENVNWSATNILANVVENGAASGGGGASPTYLLEENFEDSSYDDADWGVETGTITEAYTGVVLEGSQSLRITGAGSHVYNQVTPTGTLTDVTAYFLWRADTLGTTNCTMVAWRTSAGGTTLARILVDVNGFVKIEANGTTSSVSATQLSADQDYEVKLRFVRGGTCEAFIVPEGGTFTTTDGSGNVYLTRTGSGSFSASRLYLGPTSSSSTGWDMIYDKIRVDDEDIGNNPD